MSQRYEVPAGVEIAAQWSWRLIVMAVAGLGIFALLSFFSQITVPLAIALLITALLIGLVDWFDRRGLPRSLAALLGLVVLLLVVGGMLYLVGQQLATQFTELRASVVEGIGEIESWARNGPLNLTDDQLADYIEQAQSLVAGVGSEAVVERATAVGVGVTAFVTGFFIALFAAFFYLYEGPRLWGWVVNLFPGDARGRLNSSGQRAWESLTNFVRGTVLVATVDALGIALAAWLLGVPLTLAIGTLVFLGAFVPIVGAFASGLVAVIVALVAQGPWTAVFMLLAVIAVQQIESTFLQPFIMGHLVSVHPLAIILAIGAGIIVSGIVGALVAVPIAACLNGVVRHLAEEANNPLLEDGLPAGPPPDTT